MSVQAQIGLLEDDVDQLRLLERWLGMAGYRVHSYPNAVEFRRRYGAGAADLLVLDWNLPDESGLSVLRWLRSSGANVPVLFLTARNDEADVVEALREGADDYVGKPARHEEFLARVEALLRRTALSRAESETEEIVAPYRVDMVRRRVELNGEVIALTEREFDLVLFLFRHRGRMISREALLESVWNMRGDAMTRTVDTHISRVRKKLGLTGEHGWRLNAVYQHGYRLERS